MARERKTARIRALNDRYRRFGRGHGRTVVTRGIEAEGAAFVAKVLEGVRSFEDFTKDNDPYGERDFGALTVDGRRLFFKLDYYDPTLTAGSENPA